MHSAVELPIHACLDEANRDTRDGKECEGEQGSLHRDYFCAWILGHVPATAPGEWLRWGT
jgi:hypothetical protein